jgi:FkbM family methyltransferase
MKYYGQFNPNVDKVLHERYFPNKFEGISIECGAFDGLTDNCTKFFEDNYKWKTINIEPLPHTFKKLQYNRPMSTNLQIALSNLEETSIFRNYKHPRLQYEWGNGSINHTLKHKQWLEELCGCDNYVEFPVNCKTYKQIIEEMDIKKIDLFVLDVEGNELNVIEGMQNCDILPDIFVIEHNDTNLADFTNSLNKLTQPYVLDYVSFVNGFYVKQK